MFDWSWWPSRIPSLYGRLKTLESKLIQEKKWGRSVESVMIQISTICFGLVHITWGILILEVFQHLQIFICIRKQKKKKRLRIFSIMSIWNFLGILTVIYLWTDRNWVTALKRCMLMCPKKVIVHWLKTAQELYFFQIPGKSMKWNEFNFQSWFPSHFLPTSEARLNKNCFLSKFWM